MIDFSEKYNREEVLEFLQGDFLRDFQKDIRKVGVSGDKFIKDAFSLGSSRDFGLAIFEFEHTGSTEKRVSLTKEAFRILKESGFYRALAFFHSKDTDDWRFSFMTITPTLTEKGKIKKEFSNPKRFSFLLGPRAKVNTPTQFLIKKGPIESLDDLKERFSIEVVNKEFYTKISELFVELVGGELGTGRNKTKYEGLLKLPGVEPKSKGAQEFAVRLIGRLIFCWFLREKKNGTEDSLMPDSLLSYEAAKSQTDYYHEVLEPIFFKVLNVPIDSRKEEKYSKDPYGQIPYLNGGLFTPHDDDYYSNIDSKEKEYRKVVLVPDKWIQKLFKILETYNFTIDENSAFDEELSIDPEMLGRIFENLLAEINPETGESARKSTGSYYTPRVIVDYMVDESLYLYLKNKTEIGENKLRALISYDLDDDIDNSLDNKEKEEIINAIDELKILDPACGSGAFPMGILQKIVFVLQQLDPNGQYWFKAQIKDISPELKKNLQRENKEKNFDYIRKQGIIRKNIFGVDIQPIATEISRLRCFLTLVVDQKVDNNKHNRGIVPLPNLDFKFVTANTLIPLMNFRPQDTTLEIFEDRESIEALKEVREQFFNATNFERGELKDEFRKIQIELSKYYSKNKEGGGKITQSLVDWDPFSHKATEWFDPEWMFGIKDGFDIVIGNPPYVRVDDLNTEFKDIFKQEYSYAKGKYDLYFLFFELGRKLKSESGVLSYITPNKWTAADSAYTMREEFLRKRQIFEILSTSKLNIFKDVSNYPVITFLKDGNEEVFVWEASSVDELKAKNAKAMYRISYSKIFFPSKVIPINSSQDEINLLEKIYHHSFPIGEVIDFSEGLRIPKKYEKESGDYEILKQYQFGRYSNIKKGSFILKDDLGKIIKPTSIRFQKSLKEKIVIAEDALKISATIDNKRRIPQGGVYFGYSEDEVLNNRVLLSILNSNIYDFTYKILFGGMHMGGGYLRYRSKFLEVLPLPKTVKEKKHDIKLLEEYISKVYKDEEVNWVEGINKIVYNIFNLSESEASLIEASV